MTSTATVETETPATPAKLRGGSWGARVEGAANVGQVVRITTRAGKSWLAEITRIVWSGGGITLCATRSEPRQASRAPARPRSIPRNWSPCGYPGCNPGYCDECDGAGYRVSRVARRSGRCEDAPCCGCCD